MFWLVQAGNRVMNAWNKVRELSTSYKNAGDPWGQVVLMLTFLQGMNVVTVCLVAGASYLALVRSLRWRRYNAIHEKYGKKIQSLTTEEAQEIIAVAYGWDMPFLLGHSMSFAPSTARLLVATGEMKSSKTVPKRLADTAIMTATMMACPVNGLTANKMTDPRAALTFARVNWLHSHYNISNEDFLHTLSSFVVEPIARVEKYGWRKLSPLEKQALFVVWTEIGRRINIKDIPNSLENMTEWLKTFESEKMVPNKASQIIGVATMQEALYALPKFLKQVGIMLFAAALDNHVRNSFMIPKPRWYMGTIVDLVLSSMAFVQKHFMLPRLRPRSTIQSELPDIQEGKPVRFHPNHYASEPWYKGESKGLGYLSDRLLVLLGIHADVPGPRLKSEGYVLHMQGPAKYEQDGHDEVIRMAEEMLKCPIPEAWKRSA